MKWFRSLMERRTNPAQDDGRVILESAEFLRMTNRAQELTSEMRVTAAVDSAWIIERHAAGEDGDMVPRIFVTCDALGGMWTFSIEETDRRIRKYFPTLSDKAVKRSVRHLADRVAAHATERSAPDLPRRNSWVHGWADEKNNLSRL
jgi:hypothetical protein